jgi:hypothetical protein
MAPTSPSTRRLAIGLIVAVAVLIGVASWFANKAYNDALARRTAEAAPAYLNAVATRWRSGKRWQHGHDVRYGFDVDGRTLEGVRERWSNYHAGDAYTVCYDPADPSDNGLYEATVTCGGD